MDDAAGQPHQSPPVVMAAGMAQLVPEHLHGFGGRDGERQGDIGLHHPHQTGGGQWVGEVDGQGPDTHLPAKRPVLFPELPGYGFDAPPAQPQAETHVAQDEPARDQRRPGGIYPHGAQRQHAAIGGVHKIAKHLRLHGTVCGGLMQVLRRIRQPHLDLSGDGADGLIQGKGRADFVDGGVGQRQWAEKTQRHQQPQEADGPAAQLGTQKSAYGDHEQNGDAGHEVGFQQKVVEGCGTHDGQAPFVALVFRCCRQLSTNRIRLSTFPVKK